MTNDSRPHERELRALIAGVTGKQVEDLALDDDLVRELGIDSLTSLRVLALVEKRFEVQFPDDRLGEYRTLARILDHIGDFS